MYFERNQFYMKIWIARHGQTRLNKMRLMQGRTDEPLNETGIAQAKAAREKIGDIKFDAVYASPLDRAIVTGSIIGTGLTRGVKTVKWITAKNIVWAWILTIPAVIVVSGVIYLIMVHWLGCPVKVL